MLNKNIILSFIYMHISDVVLACCRFAPHRMREIGAHGTIAPKPKVHVLIDNFESSCEKAKNQKMS